MIIIRNITLCDESQTTGIHEYELLINRELIVRFTHNRRPNGLAQCLRDAADALDVQDALLNKQLIEAFETVFNAK